MSTILTPRRTIAELHELRALTSDGGGAQRVAFTPTWARARAWLRAKLAALPAEVHTDAAGNLWATLRGESERALLLGGHLDSVPDGGWLDGSLNVLAGVEILRRIHAQYDGKPPVTVRLVDWADEEGARFGKSLFGSSACSGTLDLNEVRGLKDRDGLPLPDALRTVGLDFERVKESGRELADAAAYLELHIEQGPVLLDLELPLGAVQGTFGVERHALTFHGQAAHAGSTPMHLRRDAFLAAAKMAPLVHGLAVNFGGVGTIGSCTTWPGIVTSVVEECRLTLDLRHLDAAALTEMLRTARTASEELAREGGLQLTWQRLCQVAPRPFHDELIALCEEAIRETCGRVHRLPSGPLHDATELAAAGIPSAMMFVQSLHGLSHTPREDTKEAHLELAVIAFDRLTEKVLGWLAARPVPGGPDAGSGLPANRSGSLL